MRRYRLTGALKMENQKMENHKMQDLKIQDQMSEAENAGPKNAGTPRNAASLVSFIQRADTRGNNIAYV